MKLMEPERTEAVPRPCRYRKTTHRGEGDERRLSANWQCELSLTSTTAFRRVGRPGATRYSPCLAPWFFVYMEVPMPRTGPVATEAPGPLPALAHVAAAGWVAAMLMSRSESGSVGLTLALAALDADRDAGASCRAERESVTGERSNRPVVSLHDTRAMAPARRPSVRIRVMERWSSCPGGVRRNGDGAPLVFNGRRHRRFGSVCADHTKTCCHAELTGPARARAYGKHLPGD